MNPVIIRNVKIGEGIPKICVPIVGVTEKEILDEAKALQGVPHDIVEWRVDWYEDVFSLKKVKETLTQLREILGDTPILFTFRTKQEGGEKEISWEEYRQLNSAVAASGLSDLIDVEAFWEVEKIAEMIDEIQRSGAKVVASNHNFEMTPSKDEVVRRLRRMQELGADVLKIAVMPQSKRDVITLLDATEEMVTNYAAQPVVTMSMSGTGVISRMAGEVFGSAITFGAVKRASAPGQIPAGELERILAIIHEAL